MVDQARPVGGVPGSQGSAGVNIQDYGSIAAFLNTKFKLTTNVQANEIREYIEGKGLKFKTAFLSLIRWLGNNDEHISFYKTKGITTLRDIYGVCEKVKDKNLKAKESWGIAIEEWIKERDQRSQPNPPASDTQPSAPPAAPSGSIPAPKAEAPAPGSTPETPIPENWKKLLSKFGVTNANGVDFSKGHLTFEDAQKLGITNINFFKLIANKMVAKETSDMKLEESEIDIALQKFDEIKDVLGLSSVEKVIEIYNTADLTFEDKDIQELKRKQQEKIAEVASTDRSAIIAKFEGNSKELVTKILDSVMAKSPTLTLEVVKKIVAQVVANEEIVKNLPSAVQSIIYTDWGAYGYTPPPTVTPPVAPEAAPPGGVASPGAAPTAAGGKYKAEDIVAMINQSRKSQTPPKAEINFTTFTNVNLSNVSNGHMLLISTASQLIMGQDIRSFKPALNDNDVVGLFGGVPTANTQKFLESKVSEEKVKNTYNRQVPADKRVASYQELLSLPKKKVKTKDAEGKDIQIEMRVVDYIRINIYNDDVVGRVNVDYSKYPNLAAFERLSKHTATPQDITALTILSKTSLEKMQFGAMLYDAGKINEAIPFLESAKADPSLKGKKQYQSLLGILIKVYNDKALKLNADKTQIESVTDPTYLIKAIQTHKENYEIVLGLITSSQGDSKTTAQALKIELERFIPMYESAAAKVIGTPKAQIEAAIAEWKKIVPKS